MPNENDENELVEAIQSLTEEVSSAKDSNTALHRALEIINDQTLASLSRKIDSLESEIRSLKDVIGKLIQTLEYDIRVRQTTQCAQK